MRPDALLQAARAGDGAAFDRLAGPHRRALTAHAYRMHGSLQDAEDTVQEALLRAWAAVGRADADVRRWLLEAVTAACLAEARPPRVLPEDRYPPGDPAAPLPQPVDVTTFVGPCLDADVDLTVGRDARHGPRESVELAFVAALQELVPGARAALLWRDVLGYDGAGDVDLDTARAHVADRVGERSQQAALDALGEDGARDLLAGLVAAWERADVDGVAALLTDDVRLVLPPLPTWFAGVDAVRRLLADRIFATPWRLAPTTVNGQLALTCHQRLDDGGWGLGALTVLTLRDDRIAQLSCFLDAAAVSGLGLPDAPR